MTVREIAAIRARAPSEGPRLALGLGLRNPARRYRHGLSRRQPLQPTEDIMTQRTSLGAKVAAAVVGGFVGLCLGIVFGSAAGALTEYALGSPPGSGLFEVGHTLGMGV